VTFYIKEGDTSPAIEHQLQDDEGNSVDITGFQEVEFHFKKENVDEVKVNENTSGGVEVTDAAQGKVQYNWSEGDTDETGDHEAEWEVTFADGTVETFPNRRNIDISVEEQIA